MKYRITPSKENIVTTDFVYNRFDLQPNIDKWETLHYQSKDEDFTFQVAYFDCWAKLGIWLLPMSNKALKHISSYIFKKHKNIKTIDYMNSYAGVGGEDNHFRIYLPSTLEEWETRASSKSKYNLKRDYRLLEQEVGLCTFISAKPEDEITKKCTEFYLKMKKQGYDYDYEGSYLDYLTSHCVSDIYALINDQTKDPISVLFSCEQCPIVYLENLTYDYNLSKYSPGAILYDYALKQFIIREKEQVFLLGGNYSYKKRYGSVEETIHYGKLTRPCIRFKQSIKKCINKLKI